MAAPVIPTDAVPTCAGKAAYSSAASALKGLKRMRRQRKWKPHAGEKLGAYRCPFCAAWHLGNSMRQDGVTDARGRG